MRCASQSCVSVSCFFFFFKQKTAYEMRISDWSSDVCSSDLHGSRPCLGRGRKRGDAANAFGRSRGGFTCKIHARSDNQGRPLGFLLTGGEASDYTAAEPLMQIPVAKPKALLADKGYDGDRFRERLLIHGILPIIPPRSNRKAPEHPDYRRDKARNRSERMKSEARRVGKECVSTCSSLWSPYH